MKDIFKLEQEIMQCWGVVDDIDLLYKYFGDDPYFRDMEGKHVDKILNLMLGLKELYELKFDTMWHTFEGVCHEYHTYRKEAEKSYGRESNIQCDTDS